MPGYRWFVATTALLSAIGAPLQAQRREFAFLAGANLSSASGPQVEVSEARAGFYLGASLRLPRSARFSLQTDLLVVGRRFYGERAPSTENPLLIGPFSDAAALTYVQLGMQARFQRGYSTVRPVRPFLTFGPYAGVLVHCDRRLVEADGGVRLTDCSATPGSAAGSTSPFFPAVYQDVDIGLLGAFGAEIRRVSVSLRAERSFRNLVEPGAIPTSPFDRARLWTVGLACEFMVRVM